MVIVIDHTELHKEKRISLTHDGVKRNFSFVGGAINYCLWVIGSLKAPQIVNKYAHTTDKS
jgi:hypothetical protein